MELAHCSLLSSWRISLSQLFVVPFSPSRYVSNKDYSSEYIHFHFSKSPKPVLEFMRIFDCFHPTSEYIPRGEVYFLRTTVERCGRVVKSFAIDFRAFHDGDIEQPVYLFIKSRLDVDSTFQCFGAYTLSKIAMEVISWL